MHFTSKPTQSVILVGRASCMIDKPCAYVHRGRGYWVQEVRRTARHIDRVKAGLLRAGAVQNDSVLGCDWLDERTLVFDKAPQSPVRIPIVCVFQ